LLVSPSPLRAGGAFAALTARLGNPTLDASFDSEWSLAVWLPGDTSVAERDQNAALGATFVMRRFRTAASLRVAAEYEGNRFVVLPPGTPLAAACGTCQVRDLVGGSLSLGLARCVTAPLATSRWDGLAVAVTARPGRRAATASVEYRVPLARVGESLGHLPFGADKLWLALFGDAGDAWNPGVAPRLGRLRSAGVELVADLTVSYDVPLEVRLGVAQPLATPPSGDARRPRVYLALAADF